MHLRHVVLENATRLPLHIEASAGGPSPLVTQLGICLLAAGFLSAIFERLRIPTIAPLGQRAHPADRWRAAGAADGAGRGVAFAMLQVINR